MSGARRDDPGPAVRPRRAALALVLTSVAVAAALGVLYHDTHGPGRIDAAVDPVLAVGTPVWRDALWAVVLLGDPVVMVVLAALVAAVSVWAGRVRVAIVALVGPALAAAVSEYLLKPGVGRTLGGTEAYPSGHTVTSVAIATVVLVLAADVRRPRAPATRALLVALAVGLPAAVAVSLVALGLHYTTDVIGGACVSLAAVLGVALALDIVGVRDDAGLRRAEPGGSRT